MKLGFAASGTIAGMFLALALVLAVVAPASAWSRDEGDFWTYDLQTHILGVRVNGTVTLVVEGEDTIDVRGQSYVVDVLRMDGNLSGSVEVAGSTLAVSARMSGFTYVTSDGVGTLKEESFVLANSSLIMGTVTVASTVETEILTTYEPPILSGFNPGGNMVIGAWDEAVTTSRAETCWFNGTLFSQDDSEDLETYSVVLSGSESMATTAAGTFACQLLTATDDGGDFEMYWYSASVGNIVKRESYGEGETEPYESMTLKEFGSTGGVDTLVVLLVAGSLVLAGVAFLVVLMLMRRRPAQPAPPAAPPDS